MLPLEEAEDQGLPVFKAIKIIAVHLLDLGFQQSVVSYKCLALLQSVSERSLESESPALREGGEQSKGPPRYSCFNACGAGRSRERSRARPVVPSEWMQSWDCGVIVGILFFQVAGQILHMKFGQIDTHGYSTKTKKSGI